ncbi:MAG TPA: C40 family peptidase [Burkholderiales bacterium]|nr:C40 family peptidase [Burkholderiales bacterium]
MTGDVATGHSGWLSRAAAGLILVALAGCATAPQQTDQDIDVGADAAQHALGMVGIPYRFGGNSPQGFDCSGLVQYSYARAGMRVSRTVEEQWANSRPVPSEQIRPGDLLFFHMDGKHNSHIGLYIGNDRFVHAPSTGKHVSVASLANRFWRQHFSIARRPFPDQAEGGL